MKIIDLLKKTKYKDIESKIKLHYGTKQLALYKDLYNKLLHMCINNSKHQDLYIFITAYRITETYDIYKVDNFDENDFLLDFDVSAYEKSSDIIYSISSASYSDFLAYHIDDETLKNYTSQTILAHCFYEITCYGFEDNI